MLDYSEKEWAVIRGRRRYEIARDCLAAMLGGLGPAHLSEIEWIRNDLRLPEDADVGEVLAANAVGFADRLLARLEKE